MFCQDLSILIIWKLANVTPIFKKGDKQLIKNYRPISFHPICGKILEKLIFNHLYSYLHTNNQISKNQSGFRPGDSATNQLLYLIDEIDQALKHDGLVFKLEKMVYQAVYESFFKII